MVITNHFNVGVKKDGNIIILNGNRGDIEDLKAILKAKIVDPSKISSEWIYPLADPIFYGPEMSAMTFAVYFQLYELYRLSTYLASCHIIKKLYNRNSAV